MELVKKGCRYTPESIASLRPSFQESVNSGRSFWEDQAESDQFYDFVESIPGQLCDSKVGVIVIVV